MSVLDIAIAGAGIGGLAVATGLARAGHRVRIFDQFEAPAPVGSGLVVQPVGLEVLRALAAEDSALARGNRITRMLGHEVARGRPVLDVSYDAPGGRFGLAIHRSALFQALFDAALAAGVQIEAGQRVTGFDGRLHVGEASYGPFDLVIDASGAGSVLSPLRSRPLGYGALWATVDWPETDLPRDELRQAYRRADRMLGVLPIGEVVGQSGRKAAVFYSLPSDGMGAWQAKGLDAWRDEAMALWPAFAPFAAQITDPAQMQMARYTHGTLRRPYGDGIAYIGDAAHRASPQLGQGANMALLDAHALVRALEQARGDVALALRWYAQARRWHVRAYQIMSALFTPQYQSDSRVLPNLRDRVLFPASRIPPVPSILTRLVCGDLLPPSGSL
ncbi:FAD-dependent oxidoreductase [Tropicibacter naphthalenivorans]|uniref:FAD-dependent urate hydroxylase n=1 Tax=Tropicibacter naphthalenivorans TaxID=441103 RepID=A0A0P1G9A3_9RHOB|nr:NAD(P)/FAD-dependent oxidoreductase [Tropicibacter naphthalenivorans]CUH78143.1 FAD-dependent urate hydroxylase [Tropicibacter naphthalenivorans]SMC93396.1 2-polyprenyl-6-methoxyphenol hydroxylase [Tropicibacter naphthalenivorans]